MITLLLLSILNFSAFAQRTLTMDELDAKYPENTLYNYFNSSARYEAVQWYVGFTGYGKINKKLRGSFVFRHWKVKRTIENLDQAIAETPKLPNIYLYRGLGLAHRDDRPYKVGEVIEEKAYASTSLDFKIADHFANYGDGRRRAVLAIYSNEKKAGLVYPGSEAEVILPRGQFFKIMKVYEGSDTYLAYRCDEPKCAKAALPKEGPELY